MNSIKKILLLLPLCGMAPAHAMSKPSHTSIPDLLRSRLIENPPAFDPSNSSRIKAAQNRLLKEAKLDFLAGASATLLGCASAILIDKTGIMNIQNPTFLHDTLKLGLLTMTTLFGLMGFMGLSYTGKSYYDYLYYESNMQAKFSRHVLNETQGAIEDYLKTIK